MARICIAQSQLDRLSKKEGITKLDRSRGLTNVDWKLTQEQDAYLNW